MSTFTPAAAYWTAVLAASKVGTARADALAALLANGTKIKFYDATNTLIRTVTTTAWTRAAVSGGFYPVTPGTITDAGTGSGTPVMAVITTSADVEICSVPAGILTSLMQLPAPIASTVALQAGSFRLLFPTTDTPPPDTPPTGGKEWYPGHYLMVINDVERTGMTEERRNLVKNEQYWRGYYGHYWWHRMETTRGSYNFSILETDLDKAEADGKKMWIMLQNRSFLGTNRGAFCPQYVIDNGWTYAYNQSGQNFIGCKLWDPACGEAWLEFQDAAIAAVKDHPALQGFATEECSQSGSWLQSGYTWQKMNAFLLAQSERGAAAVGTKLFHNNMGWSNEDSSNLTEQYRMTDTMVRIHKTGVSPNDLALEGYAKIDNNPYGKYVHTRYWGEMYSMSFCEYLSFFLPQTPRQLLDHAVDVRGMNFIGWQPYPLGMHSGMTFGIEQIKAEVARQQGRTNAVRPTNAPA